MHTVPRQEIHQRIARFRNQQAARQLGGAFFLQNADPFYFICGFSSSRFEGQLENDMVLALEPKFVFPQTGVVGLEDDYVMTAEGLKRLTLTDQSLIQI